MNVIGDEAFNMYLNAENAKPQQRTLNLDEIISGLRPSYELRDTGYCYCASNRADAAPVPAEEKHVTEILISSLNISNAEHVLSLTQNYVVEEMMFSEVALRAFFAFLANTSNGVAAKARIHSVLQEHLRLHPSCAAHMVHRYHELMLSRDEEFSGVTLLEYVICKLEQLVSVQNEVRISSTRTSRRRRRPVRMADESPAKRPARVVVFDEAAEEEETQPTETKEQPPELENLVKVLTYLIRIMRHDLGYTLKRRQPVRDCIVAKLMLAGDAESAVTTLNQALLTGICEVLKHGDTQPVLLGVCDLLGLVADVCALQEAEARGCFDVEQPGLDCRTLISAFCVAVVGEKPALGKLLPVLRQLKPQWLQYHVTRYLMEKVFCRKLPNGLRGVTCVFMAIHKNIRERVMDTTKILKLVDNNQLAAAGIWRCSMLIFIFL